MSFHFLFIKQVMQIVSWNCRGLGNPIKAEAVIDLMRIAPSDILLLQETKIEEESLLLLSKTKWKLTASKAVSARGSYGAIETLCEEKFQLKKWFSTQHWIFSELFHIASKTSHVNIILASDLNICSAPNEKKEDCRERILWLTRCRN